jgi:hypothetical protein
VNNIFVWNVQCKIAKDISPGEFLGTPRYAVCKISPKLSSDSNLDGYSAIIKLLISITA